MVHLFPIPDHESWWKWLPDDPDSFYSRITEDLDVPEDASEELCWGDEIVPLVNKKNIEIRSNFNTHCKAVILSKSFIVIFPEPSPRSNTHQT